MVVTVVTAQYNEITYLSFTNIAYIVMAYIVMAYADMAYAAVAYALMADVVINCIVMEYVPMASRVKQGHGHRYRRRRGAALKHAQKVPAGCRQFTTRTGTWCAISACVCAVLIATRHSQAHGLAAQRDRTRLSDITGVILRGDCQPSRV